MFKNKKKLALNSKILKFFLIPTILFSTPFFNTLQDAKAGLEFQWNQNSGYRKLNWLQKEKKGLDDCIHAVYTIVSVAYGCVQWRKLNRLSLCFCTAWPTDRGTEQPTNGVTYRVACTQLISVLSPQAQLKKIFDPPFGRIFVWTNLWIVTQ